MIVGPTAVGKTSAAVQLAADLQTEIISADSRQCFRELDIGVAKPSPQELRTIHHYFINSHSIREEVNAALFEGQALSWTQEIFNRNAAVCSPAGRSSNTGAGPFAVLVGGTGLYLKAFEEGLDEIPATDPGIRQQIQQQYEQEGLIWLQQQIAQLDPAFHGSGEIHNPQRLMRALEVRLSTGNSILTFRRRGKKERPFHIQKIGLQLPKEQLHQRIHERVDMMMAEGLLEEVKSLIPDREHNALQTVGYRELFDHLDGRLSLDEAVAAIKTNTRRYAKRQMTWFRRDPTIQWMDAGQPLPPVL